MSLPIPIAQKRRGLSILLPLLLTLACEGSPGPVSAPGGDPPGEQLGAAAPEPLEDHAATASPPEPMRRALWVLCEGSQRVLEHPERIDGLIAEALALEATDLFVQVYRGGRAWYDSSLAESDPYRALFETHGIDTLDELVQAAHRADLRVHAWVNVLSLSGRRNAKLLDELGEGAVHVDRRGRSLLDYPELEVPKPDAPWYRMGTRGVYLDPAAPGVAERLIAIFGELAQRYPALDGIHLDYIRHPGVLPFTPGSRFGVGLDFGYGDGSLLQFQRDTGLRPPKTNTTVPENSARWDEWRREKVTELVAGIRAKLRAVQPHFELSAAVISYADRAYLSLYQDWKRWLEEDLIDFAVPMVYTVDDRLLRYQVESFAGSPHARRIWAGLGVWLFRERPERAVEQLAIARSSGLGGDALFSWDSLADSPELFTALSTPAEPPPLEAPRPAVQAAP